MTQQQRNTWFIVAGVVVAFGAGAGWQFVGARHARQERDTARQEVTELEERMAVERLEATLAMATVAAQFGDFERGRQLASDYFVLLQAHVNTAPEATRPALNEMLTRRDGIITTLSRAQPESGFELAGLLTWLQRALGREATVAVFQEPGTAGG